MGGPVWFVAPEEQGTKATLLYCLPAPEHLNGAKNIVVTGVITNAGA
jgi:hypothetical protein